MTRWSEDSSEHGKPSIYCGWSGLCCAEAGQLMIILVKVAMGLGRTNPQKNRLRGVDAGFGHRSDCSIAKATQQLSSLQEQAAAFWHKAAEPFSFAEELGHCRKGSNTWRNKGHKRPKYIKTMIVIMNHFIISFRHTISAASLSNFTHRLFEATYIPIGLMRWDAVLQHG